MATIGNTVLTLGDWAKRLDPDGKVAKIVEMLEQKNEMLTDMLWMEGNLPTGHQTTIRTGLPTAYYRLINQGVPKSKSTTAQITEQAAMLEARSEIDVEEIKLNANNETYRLSESLAFMQAMNIRTALTMIYGSAATPNEFVGLANRYNDLSAANGENILDAGGTGSDNTSLWLVGWGAESTFGVFPKGSTAGLEHKDLGEQDSFDSDLSDARFRAMHDLYQWKQGLVVRDWRNTARIANVDVSDLIAGTGTQANTAATFLMDMMSRAIDHIFDQNSVNLSFYANRTVLSHLRVQARRESNNVLTIEKGLDQFGKTIHTITFLGIPVRLMDTIVNTEAQVV